MIIEIGKYQVRPCNGGICYELFHLGKDRKTGKPKWQSMRRFPSTLEGAFIQISNFMAADDTDTHTLDDAISRLEAIADTTKEAAENA